MLAPGSESSEDIQACLDLQNEEWGVIQSIYPDYVSTDTSQGLIKLEVPIELSKPTQVAVVEEGHSFDAQGTGQIAPFQAHTVSLSSLPPLILELILPPLYPLRKPPVLVSVHATHSWLPMNSVLLQQKLRSLWQEGDGVLFTWIEWIRSGEFLDSLRVAIPPRSEGYIRISHPAPSLLLPRLTAHDVAMQESKFSEASYACEICLTSIKGARCIRLSCTHVFCRSCLEDFWKLCITEGDVGRVGCPDPRCVKQAKEASEEEIRRVVSEEEVQRWKWLRQKRLFEQDPSMIHCPLAFCQTPVPKPTNAEDGSGWDRLRTCSECGFSFCAHCRRTWHGPISDCLMSSTESFVMEYIALPEDSPQRELIERRYGKTNVRKLIAKYEEDQANKAWLENSTMACPSCRIKVEKSVGCNHMTCAKCGQHFCYRCGDKIQAANPYLHFSTPGHQCYQKLFDYQSTDHEWQPVEGFDDL